MPKTDTLDTWTAVIDRSAAPPTTKRVPPTFTASARAASRSASETSAAACTTAVQPSSARSTLARSVTSPTTTSIAGVSISAGTRANFAGSRTRSRTVVSRFGQPCRDMRADETRPTGHEHRHAGARSTSTSKTARVSNPSASYTRIAGVLSATTCRIGVSPRASMRAATARTRRRRETLPASARVGAHGTDLGESRSAHPFSRHRDETLVVADPKVRAELVRALEERPGLRPCDEREHLGHIRGPELDERVVGRTDRSARDHLDGRHAEEGLPIGRSRRLDGPEDEGRARRADQIRERAPCLGAGIVGERREGRDVVPVAPGLPVALREPGVVTRERVPGRVVEWLHVRDRVTHMTTRVVQWTTTQDTSNGLD